MKKILSSALSVLIFIILAIAAVSTGIVMARGSLPAEKNNSPVQAASLNNVSGKIVEAQSTPAPALMPAQEPTLEATPYDTSLEATQAPEAGNTEVENTDDSSSGNSFSEDGSADQAFNGVSAGPATIIANPFSSEGGHR